LENIHKIVLFFSVLLADPEGCFLRQSSVLSDHSSYAAWQGQRNQSGLAATSHTEGECLPGYTCSLHAE